MSQSIRFCLVLHNHQPIGNFDHVFQQAYEDSYAPFLDVFEPYEDLRISLHTSGPLMQWLEQHQPAYLKRLARFVHQGRIEIIGGAFYEPIMTMIPPRDRVGQVRSYSDWLAERLKADVQGAWIPERVWEQNLTCDLHDAGVRYTVLDDFHFRNAGLDDDQLHGYYVTEDDGRLLSVFPGSEQLRYCIPFADPQATIDYLGHVASQHANAVVVFGDDGEKFGTWPETKKHVYEDGWLQRFFDLLAAHRDWIHTTTLAEAVDNVSPLGKIYLPDASYREMTEWSLPVDQQLHYEQVIHDMQPDQRWERLKRFVRGGYWRNFKVKYPEANEMYARMMTVSQRLHQLEARYNAKQLQSARQALYRSQCNCAYWHGAFGGIYLPHLRNALYNQFIAADNMLDQVEDKQSPWVEATVDDYNLDARQEVRLATDRLVAWLAPASGGWLYELDVRSICHNLLATLARRPEAYHKRVLSGNRGGDGAISSIHDRVVFKQAELDKRLFYDTYPRKSLIDHFYDNDASLDSVRSGTSMERGDFAQGVYETKIRRNPDCVQILLHRQGNAWGHPLRITKGITVQSGGSALEIAYLMEGLKPQQSFHFAVEWNFAGMPSGAEDRFFFQGSPQKSLGQLGTALDLHEQTQLGLIDQWLGLQVHLTTNRPTSYWAFPIETVSQSEGGFELVHQSVAVLPHWWITADAEGRWSVTMRLDIDTSLAESRMPTPGTVGVVAG